jgi:succinyl-CoA synthetase beta subunit
MSLFVRKIPKVAKLVYGAVSQQLRNLNLQEHISHSILNEHGIKTPSFEVARTVDEAKKIARDLSTKNLMVKAQVLAGGRGLGKFKNGFKGGVHSATR